jgi:septum formation protein
MMPSPRLILASASPRRRELLHAAGFDFEVHPAEIDEDDYPPQTLPADLAQRLAQLKAAAIAERFPDDVVLAADTVVAFGDKSLGKPANDAAATKMLELLSGTTHIVITGIALVHQRTGIARSARVLSAVKMKPLSSAEIRRYVESGDWQGKAGGYGIQDQRHDPFVTRMSGSYTNIVGLPMERTVELLAGMGVVPTRPATTSPRAEESPSPPPIPAPVETPTPKPPAPPGDAPEATNVSHPTPAPAAPSEPPAPAPAPATQQQQSWDKLL